MADVRELYLVEVGALGVSVKLNPPLVGGGDAEAGFRISSDSEFVAYRADQDADEVRELYRVALTSPGVSAKVNSPMPDFGAGASGDVFAFRIRPDALAIAYTADQATDGIVELFEVAMNALETSTRVHPALAGSTVSRFEYAAGSDALVYAADQDIANEPEVYVTDLAQLSTSTQVNAPLISGGSVQDLTIPQ
jgi:hypothetical protein